ncbi:hypothetical protein HRbin08_01667 [bacterium HR08]|nr:hypothetical protein HRbin08_01667 [bacterium HR08]
MVVGAAAIGAEEELLHLRVHEGGEAGQATEPVNAVQPEVAQESRHDLARESRGQAAGRGRDGGRAQSELPERGDWRQLVLEPGLRGDGAGRHTCAQLGGHGIVSLSERLTGGGILHEEGDGVEVDRLREVPPQAPDVPDLQERIPGQFPLDGEVDAVHHSWTQRRIGLEGEELAERCRGDQRWRHALGDGQRSGAINADSERLSACVLRSLHGDRLAEARRQHGDRDQLHEIEPVECERVSAAEDGLSGSEHSPQETALEARMPGQGDTRADVVPVRIHGLLPTEHADRGVADRRIEDRAAQGGLPLGLQILLRRDDPPGGGIHGEGDASIQGLRGDLDLVVHAVAEGQRGAHAPHIARVEVPRLIPELVHQGGAEGQGGEVGVAGHHDGDVVDDPQKSGIVSVPARDVRRAQAILLDGAAAGGGSPLGRDGEEGARIEQANEG